MKRNRVKRGIFISIIVLLVIAGLIIAFISPIAKYTIEKYDVKIMGRQVKIDWLYLNPFTGTLHLGKFKIYEAGSDSIALSADGLSVGFDMVKLMRKTYEINRITLDKPVWYIIQTEERGLNFSDIIEKFSSKDTVQVEKKEVRFNILDIKIIDGTFYYREPTIPVNYFIKKVNFESSGKRYNVDSMNLKLSFQSGPGSGDVNLEGVLDLDSLRYNLRTISIKHFDLKILEQYLKELANYGKMSAFLDLEVSASGGFKDKLDLDARGLVSVSDFHFGKTVTQDFASFDKLVLDLDRINPKNRKYYIDSVMIDKLFFMYEMYDELNNLEKMFGKGGSKIKAENTESSTNLIIQIARYVEDIAKNFLESYYKVNKLAVYRADFKFNDFSQREKFSVEASPVYLIADSIDRRYKRVGATLTSSIKPYGKLSARLSLDPNNYGNFDLKYHIDNVAVSMFNPYVISFTSFPLDRGILEFDGYMHVVDSNINSNNHLLIVDPRLGKRIKKKDTKWLPAPLIMALARSTGNAIDIEVPIRGSLNDPKFKLWGVVGEVLKNIFVKPPSAGYLMHVKNVEREVEKSMRLRWGMRQTELTRVQEKFIDRAAEFLEDNPEATISVTPVNYAEKEKEHLLLFEAKKKFWSLITNKKMQDFTEDDSLYIDKMSVKDSAFIRYLKKHIGDTMMYTVQEKALHMVGSKTVNDRYQQLLDTREKLFKSYFKDPARVIFKPDETSVPFNGFSFYRIDYKGEVPEYLKEAYEELLDLNEENPRAKYREKRKERVRMIRERQTNQRQKDER